MDQETLLLIDELYKLQKDGKTRFDNPQFRELLLGLSTVGVILTLAAVIVPAISAIHDILVRAGIIS